MTTYDQPAPGEWIRPVRRGYKMACCDCGLVHTMDFRIVKGRVWFRVFRNNRSTAMMRRHKGLWKKPDGGYTRRRPVKRRAVAWAEPEAGDAR